MTPELDDVRSECFRTGNARDMLSLSGKLREIGFGDSVTWDDNDPSSFTDMLKDIDWYVSGPPWDVAGFAKDGEGFHPVAGPDGAWTVYIERYDGLIILHDRRSGATPTTPDWSAS